MRDAPYTQLRQITEAERGWLVGLFEGEGSASISQRGVTVCIAMTDRDVVERVQRLFPSPQGIRTRSARGLGWKPQYEWRIRQRALVAEFLRLILPLLGERRTSQAQLVLARAEDPLGGLGSGHRRKTHCPSGHPYDYENTSINAAGHRRCRTCCRLKARKRRARA